MMKSSSLENWDGRLSNSENKTTQNIAIGGLRTWKDQSNPPANSDETLEAINDVSKVGTAFSDDQSNLAGIEGSRHSTDATSMHGLHDEHVSQIMGPSSLMNIPSSVQTVPITPTKVHNASNNDSTPTRKFIPADSPLLQRFHEYNASSSNTDLAKRLEAAISGAPLPRAKNNIDVISMHSADAEGEDEDESDDIIVAESLLWFPPSKSEHLLNTQANPDVDASTPSEHNSLFSPPPEDYPPAELLFTPPPSHKPLPSSSKSRLILSHVEVPPCPYPKASYKLLPLRPTQKKSRVSSQPVKIHQSLGEALQASLSHNNSIGVMDRPSGQAKNKSEKKNPHGKIRNAVAGPSKSSIAYDSSSIVNNDHSNKKRHVFDDEKPKHPKKKQKVHVDIDLTLSDNERRVTKNPETKLVRPKPKPKPIAKRKSNYEKHLDSQPVFVNVVKPLPIDVWSLNIRFVRNKLKKSATLPLPLSKKRKCSSPRRTPGFLPLSSPQSEVDDDADDVSLGDPIPTSWRADLGDDEDSDSESDVPLILKTTRPPRPQGKQSCQPSSTPSTTSKGVVSRKIDLAAFYRNKDKLKVKTGPTQSSANTPHRLNPSTTNPSASVVGLTTPSHSQSFSLPKNPSLDLRQEEREEEQEEPLVPVTLSAKALGKRRAISPLPHSTQPRSPSSHNELLPGNVGHQEFDQFINNYGVLSPGHPSYANGLTLSARYSPSLQPSILPLYPSESASALDVGPGPDGFQGVTEIEQFDYQAQQTHFWTSLGGNVTEYQYTTVDPSLLGGNPMFEEPAEQEQTIDLEQDDNNFGNPFEGIQSSDADSNSESESGPVAGPSVVQNRSSTTSQYSPSSNSASLSHEHAHRKERSRSSSVSSSSNSAVRSEVVFGPSLPPAVRQTSPKIWKKGVSRSPSFVYEQQQDRSSGSEYQPSPKGEHRKPREVSSPSSYDPEVLSEKDYSPSTTSNHEPSVGVNKGKQREPSAEGVRTMPKRQRVQRQRADMVDTEAYLESSDGQVVKEVKAPPGQAKTKKPSMANVWPTCDEFLCCHQCRNKSNRVKMVCSRCNAIYCCRCIANRYAELQFVKEIDSCPRCNKYCNCTACCGRRGETYVAIRRGPPQKKLILPLAAPVMPDKRVIMPTVMPDEVERFGTVYDLNGKRLAVTYCPSGGEEGSTPTVVFVKGTGNQLPEYKKTRVFVGKVQRCWGLGRDAIIKEIRPMAQPKKAQKNTVLRTFVGRRDFLKFPRTNPEDEDEDEDEDELSSLSTLTDSEEAAGDREDVENFHPHNLGDDDVSRAIILALSACGLMINPNHSSTA